VRDGERGHHRDQRAEAAERDHQAEQEQQVIGAVEDVEEAELDELQRRLVPARIELDQTGVAEELETAHRAAGRQEAQHRQRPDAEARQPRLDREARLVRLNRVLEQHVEQPLAPEELGRLRQAGRRHVRDRLVVGRKRLVRLQRRPNRDHARRRQLLAVFVEIQEVRNPQRRRVLQGAVGAGQVEQIGVPGAARLGIVHVAHRLQRRAHQQPQPPSLGLQEGLDGDVVGDVVRGRRGRERRQYQKRDEKEKPRGTVPVHSGNCILRRP
jgi:hypothetical protein